MDAALFHEPRRRMIRLHDGEMAALDFGDGARAVDVIFAHANGLNAMTYRSILGPLSLSLRIMAVDLRGHGSTRLPAEPRGRCSWRDLKDDLCALIDATGERPLVLAGHSMGATAMLLAAAERPRAVRSLVLFDPVVQPRWAAPGARAPWLLHPIWRWRAPSRGALRRRAVFESYGAAFNACRGRGAFRTWPEIMVADYVANGFRERPDGSVELACAPSWEASNYAALGNDPWRALRRLRAPVHIYRAEQSSTCRAGAGSAMARRLPHARLVTVAGSSRFLPMERPDVVRDALLDAAGA